MLLWQLRDTELRVIRIIIELSNRLLSQFVQSPRLLHKWIVSEKKGILVPMRLPVLRPKWKQRK